MNPEYARTLDEITRRAEAAERNLRQPSDRRQGSGYGAWLRAQHYRRLETAQRAGWHWWHQQTIDRWICTCGLLRRGAVDIPSGSGHRRWPDGRNEVVFVLTGAPESSVQFRLTCLACGWREIADSLPQAANHRSLHQHWQSDSLPP